MTDKKPDIEALRMAFQATRIDLKKALEDVARINNEKFYADDRATQAKAKYNKAAEALACAVDDTTPKVDVVEAVEPVEPVEAAR